MIRKSILFLVALLQVICILTAFGQTSQLNWLGHWKGEEKREQLVEEVRKEYEFLYPDVTLHFMYD